MIDVTCPSCGHPMSVPSSLVGQRDACPACGKQVEIPSPVTEVNEGPVPIVAHAMDGPGKASVGVSQVRGVLARHRLLVFVAVIVLLCAGALIWWLIPQQVTPRRAMMGHWQEIGTQTTADNTNYKGSVQDNQPGQIFISRDCAWRVEPGERPVRVGYEVLEENQDEFWLAQCVVSEKGQRIYSRVVFSPDRREMRVITRLDLGDGLPDDMAQTIREQVGGATVETAYRRVDDKRSP